MTIDFVDQFPDILLHHDIAQKLFWIDFVMTWEDVRNHETTWGRVDDFRQIIAILILGVEHRLDLSMHRQLAGRERVLELGHV